MIGRKPKTNYAFIDSQNLNLGTQKVGWKMDWAKFLEYLRREHNVGTAYLFIGYMREHEDMYKQLHELGYLVVLKPTVGMYDTKEHKHDKKPPVKGNIDAEMVLYAMKDLPKYKQAIIVSGDGDFYCLAEYLEEKGRLKAILAPNWQYSSLLKKFDNYIIRLDQLRSKLEHKDRYKKPRR